jgi:hypothetical protein
MKGSVMPLAGISLQVHTHVDDRLEAEHDDEAGNSIAGEVVMLPQRGAQAAQHDEGEQDRHDDQAQDDAELLAGDGEDEVGMAVGMTRLTVPSPGPDAEPAAIDNGVAAHVDLEGVALAGHEAVDASGDVREKTYRRQTGRHRPAQPSR